jgi:hypothetical protein
VYCFPSTIALILAPLQKFQCPYHPFQRKKNADELEDLLSAFSATACPWQLITGEPLEPPFVPKAAFM